MPPVISCVMQGVSGVVCRVADLCCKQVVNVRDGCCLGTVSDLEIDTVTARILSLVIYGKFRFLFFFRSEDIIIHWCDIEVIGEDTILVNMRSEMRDVRAARKGGLFGRWFS